MSDPTRQVPSRENTAWATALVTLAAIGFGVVPYFAKSLTDAGMAAPAVAFSRFVIAAVLLLPFLALRRQDRVTTVWGVFAGAAMGLGWIGYVKSLAVVPVSTAGILYMTYPMFTLLVGWIGFGDRPGKRSSFAALLILAAAFIALSPALVGAAAIPSLLLALTAPLTFGIAINVLTRKLIALQPLSRLASVSLGSVLGLLPIVVTFEAAQLLPSGPAQWWQIGGIAVLSAMIPQLLYTVNAPKIGAARAAMVGSVELPTMILIGWLAFGESIGLMLLVAVALIIGAIVITPARRAIGAHSVLPAAFGVRNDKTTNGLGAG